jgi:hypothetical protein
MRMRSLARLSGVMVALMAAACAQPQSRGSGEAGGGDAVALADRAPTRVRAAAAAQDLADLPIVHVYKSPTCGCCGDWVTHVEDAGFRTEVQDLPDVTPVKQRVGLPRHLGSCHTSLVGDYVVEGHVPADVIRRLLAEKPEIAGIAVPGMPMGSPGMEGPYTERYDIIAFRKDGSQYVFDRR